MLSSLTPLGRLTYEYKYESKHTLIRRDEIRLDRRSKTLSDSLTTQAYQFNYFSCPSDLLNDPYIWYRYIKFPLSWLAVWRVVKHIISCGRGQVQFPNTGSYTNRWLYSMALDPLTNQCIFCSFKPDRLSMWRLWQTYSWPIWLQRAVRVPR